MSTLTVRSDKSLTQRVPGDIGPRYMAGTEVHRFKTDSNDSNVLFFLRYGNLYIVRMCKCEGMLSNRVVSEGLTLSPFQYLSYISYANEVEGYS